MIVKPVCPSEIISSSWDKLKTPKPSASASQYSKDGGEVAEGAVITLKSKVVVEKQFVITKKMDLVISLKSMGYHYPINTYIELLRNCCTKNTVFIFDIGDNQYDENYLKKIFDDVKIIYEEKTNNVLRRLCCKKFKI